MIKIGKVLFRAMTSEDLKAQVRFTTSLDLAHLDSSTPYPLNLGQLEKQFQDTLTNPKPTNVTFAVETSGEYVGFVQLYDIEAVHRTCYLGIQIGNPDFWDKGYGYRIAQFIGPYAFQTLNMHKMCLSTNAKNPRTEKLAKHFGFQNEGCQKEQMWLNGEYVDLKYLGLTRDMWLKVDARIKGPLAHKV